MLCGRYEDDFLIIKVLVAGLGRIWARDLAHVTSSVNASPQNHKSASPHVLCWSRARLRDLKTQSAEMLVKLKVRLLDSSGDHRSSDVDLVRFSGHAM